MVENRIQAQACERNAIVQCCQGLIGDITQPGRTLIVFDARLSNEHWSLVALVDFLQNIAEWPRKRITNVDKATVMYPLVTPVVIDAHNVQVFWMTAEFWRKATAEHIPRLILRPPIILCGFVILWPIGDNVDSGINVKNARAGIYIPNGFTSRNCRPNQV